ncbi:unnamed protein product [Lampetra fluviatilis]
MKGDLATTTSGCYCIPRTDVDASRQDDCRSRQQQGHGAIALRERDSPAKEDEWKTSGPPLIHPRGVTSSSKVKSFRLWLL